MIIEVRDDDMASRRKDYATRRIELLPDGTIEPVFTQKQAILGEELYSMIARIGDQDLRGRRDCRIPRIIELTGFSTFLTKLMYVFSRRCKHLNTMVILVGHNNPI